MLVLKLAKWRLFRAKEGRAPQAVDWYEGWPGRLREAALAQCSEKVGADGGGPRRRGWTQGRPVLLVLWEVWSL